MKHGFFFFHCIVLSLFFFPLSLLAMAKYPNAYAVVSAHPLATEAGLEILAQGGNAFDAAVAVSAALAVVEPYHSGLGGGGFWLLHHAASKTNNFIDGREIAPLAASKNMFLDPHGQPIPHASLNGGLAAAIPGEAAGLVFIAQHYGRLRLEQSLAPAIRYAEQGFPVDNAFDEAIQLGDRQQQLKKYPASAAIFLQKNRPYPIGSLLIQRDLAKTLRRLATEGNNGFYRGEIAKQMVKAVNQAGGRWSLQDLAHYQVKVRRPLEASFHQMRVITAPLPSSGGIGLVTMLNILAHYPLQSFSKAQWVHHLVEAMRLAFWQRGDYLGDPDFVKVPLEKLLSEENTQALCHLIDPHRATPSAQFVRQGVDIDTEHHTTHFSIIDKEGNRVAATLSINFIFGSSLVAQGTGVLLNDTMDDFSIQPGLPNVFGLMGSKKNAIAPAKRPLSSMTPTFLETADRVAVLGTPGGSRIPTMVLLAALRFYSSYGAISMVSAMRFHHQYLPDKLQFEPDTFSPTLQQALRKMGYDLYPLEHYYGNMQALNWDRTSNLITAAADPRHIGRATVVEIPGKGGYGFHY
jgi:gamma-glutamyltranspeptidase/glutathione hydrolase